MISLSKLCSLIPRPRIHLTRFHGVFAPHFKYRSLIIPDTNSKKASEKTENKETRKSYSMAWAKRLKRVFGIDIQTCLRCGGKIKVISAIEEVQVIQRILTHRGKNYRIPKLYPPREPPKQTMTLSLSESIFMVYWQNRIRLCRAELCLKKLKTLLFPETLIIMALRELFSPFKIILSSFQFIRTHSKL